MQRWLKFVKYLPSFGWKPVVFVPQNPEYPEYDPSLEKDVPVGLEIMRCPIWEPFGIYKKLTGRRKDDRLGASFLSEKKPAGRMHNFMLWIRANFFIPDARKFWVNPSVRFLSRYLKENPVNVVVTTGPPMSVHMIGFRLKRKTGLPWLADFRDPWTSVDFYHELNLMRWADRKHHRMERQVLESADQVTVISRGMAEDFGQIVSRPYHVITNGYDQEDFATTETELDRKFSIAHFGSLGKARDPEVLWQALSDMKIEIQHFSGNLEIKLGGHVDYQVMESIRRYGLEEHLNRIGYLLHGAMVQELMRSQVLLLVINNTPSARLIATGKVFEYLAARRPVLCIGPEDGDAAGIVREAEAGEVCGFDQSVKLKEILAGYYGRYSRRKLQSEGKGIERYSRKYITGMMAERLNMME